MSVLIKGMKMPASCYDCDCFIRDSDGINFCCILMQDIEDNNKHNDDCPLVELPPHGRLIDADALKNKPVPLNGCLDEIHGAYHYYPPTYIQAIEEITNAPTIIPAEENET